MGVHSVAPRPPFRWAPHHQTIVHGGKGAFACGQTADDRSLVHVRQLGRGVQDHSGDP